MFERLLSTVASARETVSYVREHVSAAVNVARGIVPNLPISALSPFGPSFFQNVNTGDKFPGGFGETQLLTADYWTLRARSRQLFETNLYARGLIRRLVTNEIAVGLHLEATPQEKLLGKEEDSLADWSEDVEQRFALWQADPWLCDHAEQRTFGALQIAARMDALIEGDVLVVLRQFSPTQLPRVQLISGGMVRTPYLGAGTKLADGHRIVHGVELDALNRHVAYWVTQDDSTSKRIPAWGPKSGRRLAWLVYGTERRLDDVRGKPLLSLILQSLREIDRYRDSVQRKAVINSMLAMFVERTSEKGTSTRPMVSGAVRKGSLPTGNTEPEQPRRFNTAEMIPGLVIDELAVGEKPVGFNSNGTDEKFGEFEEAVLQTIAWTNEIPPEILRLSFSSNYSASQAAINEFKLYLNKVRTAFGDEFCQPIYIEWLLSMVLASKITATQLLEAWRNPRLYDVFGAWTSCDWTGNIKLAVDLTKLVNGYDQLIKMGGCTRDRMSRELTGTKFANNVKKLRLENEALVRANEPLLRLDSKLLAAEAGAERAAENDAGDEARSDKKDAAATPLRVVS